MTSIFIFTFLGGLPSFVTLIMYIKTSIAWSIPKQRFLFLIPDSYILTDVREDRTCQIWKSQIQMPWTMVEPLCTLATEDSKTYSTHTFQKILRITEFKKLYGTNQCKKWHKWESGTDESRAHVIMKWLSWCIRSNK